MRDFLKGFLGQPQTPEQLKEMLEEAAAVEREACAKLCDDLDDRHHAGDYPPCHCADVIRARGNP